MKDQNEWTPMERLLALQTASEKFCDIGILLPRKEELAAELFQIALPYSTTSIPAGATLLHLLALEIMRKRLNTRVLSAIDYGLRCCALPHARNASGSTPFHTLITEWSAWRRPEGDMAVWLRLACQAGLDLEVYGQCEAAVVREAREMAIDAGLDSEDLYFRYTSCGADPHHWKLWPRHPGDYFAGIFWDMVEHPERALPGSWLEPDPDWQYPDTGYEEPAIGPRRDPGVRRKTLRKFQKELRTFQRTGQAHSSSRIANMSDILRLVDEDARARKPRDAHTRNEFKDRLRTLKYDLGIIEWQELERYNRDYS